MRDQRHSKSLANGAAGRRRGRLWARRIFIAVNVAGVVLAMPLLSAVFPLLRIWWDTRSQASVTANATLEANARARSETRPVEKPDEAAAAVDLQSLTNQLDVIRDLSDAEIHGIVTSQFGERKRRGADPAKFDRESAVFHNITRTTRIVNGKEVYCYEVDLVDENGNHRIQMEYCEQPDMDYERSMATLRLVNGNPQLKKIYDAFAHVLAERSSSSNAAPDAGVTVRPPLSNRTDELR